MALASLLLAAALLPLSPAPAAPFPRILTDAPTITDIAPGVKYGDYQMNTVDGPLSVHVVAVDLREPTVRIGTTLATDKLISPGETLSSMAHRTGAVAGINGDYFDINQTNQPLNILVQDGHLVRMPMHRWAIALSKAKDVQFAEFDITQTAMLPGGTLPLKMMNDWPPPGGGAVLITPEYGPLRAVQNVTEFALTPASGTPPFGTYTVSGIVDNTQTQPAGYYLALGLNAYGSIALPNPGDSVTIDGTATPALDDIDSAIGGGPLLVKDGAWYADPDGPSKGEFATHMPASGVAVKRDGTLLFFEIDGRQPALSIGVLQPQLAALMIAFGAVTGMQFDGGGSSTIVARVPGDATASVLNSPSDGVERRIADGLLVYSDAPDGPAARMFATPQVVRALPGARVPVRIATTDASGHPASPCTCTPRMRVIPGNAGAMDGDVFVAGRKPQDAVIRVEEGALRMDVPVHVTTQVARAEILPKQPALLAHETVSLHARAFDSHGYPIALPDRLPWATNLGKINATGAFQAAASDAVVSVRLGKRVTQQRVTVGEHAADIPLLLKAAFATAPANGPGSLSKDTPCRACLSLQYDFSGNERAAYVNAPIVLPQRALGISADVFGDGNGEVLRLAINNAINERFLYTLAKVDWRGWRHVELRFPPELPQPITFKSIYVIDRVGPGPAVQAAGSIALRNVRVLLAGSASKLPK
jgi:exopolysaccharide biosynthesis protein